MSARPRRAPTDAPLRQAVGSAGPVLVRVTRLGFAAKGWLTILVGVLALQHALGRGGALAGQGDAIRTLSGRPFGRSMLLVLCLGLAAYAVWMFVAAAVDPERKGRGVSGILERLSFVATGIGYAILAGGAFNLLLGSGQEGSDLDQLAARVLTPVFGRLLVGLVGGIVMVAGLLQLRLGITAGFRENLRRDLSPFLRAVTVVSGRIGYMALGTLSLLVGLSLVRVAVEYDPSEAAGWDEALGFLASIGEGRLALAAAALGLILYGAYFVLLVRAKAL